MGSGPSPRMNPLRFLLPLLLWCCFGAQAGSAPADLPEPVRRRLRAGRPRAAEPSVFQAPVAADGRVEKRQPAAPGAKRMGPADLSSLLQFSVEPDGQILDALAMLDDDEGPPEW
mmetsp:Transcript_15595/g.43100  ORF Transcript_15595/g.43100 Transcript_15595/m.43100 type:complete len:115 (-) Transcript_15595:193-537(-)